MTWLDTILHENRKFRDVISPEALPKERQPYPYAIVTCMDPRVNLAAAGVTPFRPSGQIQSQVRVIQTAGGIADQRSLVIGIHMAGFKEIAVIMHTDCGCTMAYAKIDTIMANLRANLSARQWQEFNQLIGEPFRENLLAWLQAFEDPAEAVKKEVRAIKNYVFTPEHLIVHGLVYDLSDGTIAVIVNGYDSAGKL